VPRFEIVHVHRIEWDAETRRCQQEILGQLRTIVRNVEKNMASIEQLKAELADLVAKVAARNTAEASAAELIKGLKNENKALADQVAGLKVGQADIDTITQQVKDTAAALDAGTQQLQASTATDGSAPPATPPA
jgi:peptidoglycan hydrolase CwlO-like protein